MDSTTAPLSRFAAKEPPPPLLIRAPLTSFGNDDDEDEDTDISPLASSEDNDNGGGYETAETSDVDAELAGVSGGHKGGALARSLSMPVAPLTGDEDFGDEEFDDVGTSEEDVDGFFGVARVGISDQNRSLEGADEGVDVGDGDREELASSTNVDVEKDESLGVGLEVGDGNVGSDFSVVERNLEAASGGSSLSKNESLDRVEDTAKGAEVADENTGNSFVSENSEIEESFKDCMSMAEMGKAREDSSAASEAVYSLDDAIEVVDVGKGLGGCNPRDDNDGKLSGELVGDTTCFGSSSDVTMGLQETLDVPDILAVQALLRGSDTLPGESDTLVDADSSDNVASTYHKDGEFCANVADYNVKVNHSETKEREESSASAIVEIVEDTDSARQIAKDLDENFVSANLNSWPVEGLIASESDEEIDSDDEDERRRTLEDAIAALLKAASSSGHDGSVSISDDGNSLLSADRSASLASSALSLEHSPIYPARSNTFNSSELHIADTPDYPITEEDKKLHEKVELLRIKFLRLVHRLGHSAEDPVVEQVLYRLNLIETIRHGRPANQSFSLGNARKKALQLEAEENEGLDFSCNILVLGKSGVGKSATINSIFEREKSLTNAFKPATVSVKVITGTIDGVTVRVIDTPGLRMSGVDQSYNRSILSSVKKYAKKFPPDVVLYVDRLDIQTRDISDLPLLRTITGVLGSSIWFKAIVALTHAASAPPEGPNGSPLSFDMLVAQRSYVIQQSTRLAAGDMHLMNPVALVENHTACARNTEGHRVLPNGVNWRSKLMLLCYSSKILSEANSLVKFQDSSIEKLLGFRFRSIPLPFLLSSLLQSRAYPKLPADQCGENVDSDIDLDDFSDADQDDDEFDQLPPFKSLSTSQLAMLTNDQRKAYFDEYDYRVKLLQKKQWKEEIKRLKEIKNKELDVHNDFISDDLSQDFNPSDGAANVPVPLPDMVLPPSFDSDSPTYRYRFLEPSSQFLARPVLDTHGWDHDFGYDTVTLEDNLALGGQFPAVISAQIGKDKKEFNIHLDSSISVKHSENATSLAGVDIQPVGKQLAYMLRGETKFKNSKKNKTTGGVSLTFLGETLAIGLKIEDQLSIGRRGTLVGSAGAVKAKNDTVYGANLEARLRDEDYPIGKTITTLGLSLMRWHGDLALGANLQSQFSMSRSKLAVRVGLNNKRTGQITIKMNTSEQLQVALVGIIPIAASLLRSLISRDSSR